MEIIEEFKERECLKCHESWPDDEEFFKSEKDHFCIACRKEIGPGTLPSDASKMPPRIISSQLAKCRAARLAAKGKQT